MSNPSSDCAPVTDLLGAYALDAVDPDEAAAVRQHLQVCPRCAQEVAEFRETIGLVAAEGGDAPEQLWSRIAASIDAPGAPPALPLPSLLRPQSVPVWRRWFVALTAAAAAAAVVLVGVQTVRVDHLDHRVGQLSAAAERAAGTDGVGAALSDPSAHRLLLTSTSSVGEVLGELVILPSGGAYMISSAMPALPASSTYQLWSVTAGRPVSVGVLGRSPGTVAFTADNAVTVKQYLVTVEPAGGVTAPTTAPVAQTQV